MAMYRWAIYGLIFGLVACSAENTPRYPSSSATYSDLNEEVGCKSRYVDEKKNDIFMAQYKNRWMTWKGTVLVARAEEAFLNLDDGALPDLHVIFTSPKDGYDLQTDSVVSVKFLMVEAGGCLMPYEGRNGSIIEDAEKFQFKQVINLNTNNLI